MSNYNLGAGMNEKVLNEMAGEIYSACYPTLFKGSVAVNKFNVATVDWDVTEAPVFDLKPSANALKRLKNSIDKELEAKDKDLAAGLQAYIEKDVITLRVTVPKIVIRMTATGGKPSPKVTGSVWVDCQADISIDNILNFAIIDADIDLEGEEMMQWILNTSVLPMVKDHLNKTVLKGIPLPRLSSGDITLSTPAAMMENETLTVFAALSTQGATEPPEGDSQWPADKSFVFADTMLMDMAAMEVLKGVKESGSAGTKILILSFQAGYQVGLKNPRVEIDTGDQVSVTVDAYGGGTVKATLDTGLFKIPVTLGMNITATPKIEAGLSVDEQNRFTVTFDKVQDFHVEIDLRHVPKLIDKFASGIISFLTKPLVKLITGMLKGKQIHVFTIPVIKIAEEGVHAEVFLKELAFNDMTDSGGKKLLTVSGEIDIEKS